MLSVLARESRHSTQPTRREILRAGGLTLGGLTLPQLLAERQLLANVDVSASAPMFGRAKNVIFLYLAGGPPQHETFDPKPEAPVEIRGPFQSIQTNIPGIRFCELLPRTAQMAERLAVIRSMATDDNIHSSSSAWVLTGHKYRGPNARVQTPADWPYFGSIVKMLKPSMQMPGLTTVWLPDVMRLNENVTPAGQTGGFLGPQWNPDVFVGDPSAPQYRIESLQTRDVSAARLDRRRSLLTQIESMPGNSVQSGGVPIYENVRQQAFDLLTSGRARSAFDIASESATERNRYGRNRWGQCVLLARRLVEAGVRLVHVHWPREPGDNAVDNPLWDTHAQNADRLEDVLCPMFDVGYTALLNDLDERGLLDETLVVAIGEFGRTPKINAKGGRDHWGAVFSCVLAGAGISGGQVYGASDNNGAYPVADLVRPGDLTATIFHLLGIPYLGGFQDRQGREHRLTEGEPLYTLLGDSPAGKDRTEPTADISRVPPFDPERLLAQTDFSSAAGVLPAESPSRPKGWRTDGSLIRPDVAGLGIRMFAGDEIPALPIPHAAIGFESQQSQPLHLASGAGVRLGQEVRSPFAGTYQLRVRLRATASSESLFTDVLLRHFSCRLLYLQYDSTEKRIDEARTLAAQEFTPLTSSSDLQTIVFTHKFANPAPGRNFSFGAGMGVAIELTPRGSDSIEISGEGPQFAYIHIADVHLHFVGKERDPNVTV